MRGYLLMGTRATDGGGRKNHGKPASPPTELGANKTSYASAKIGEETSRDTSVGCSSIRPLGIWTETAVDDRTGGGLGPSCGREPTPSPFVSQPTRADESRIGGVGKMGRSHPQDDPVGLSNPRCCFGFSATKQSMTIIALEHKCIQCRRMSKTLGFSMFWSCRSRRLTWTKRLSTSSPSLRSGG